MAEIVGVEKLGAAVVDVSRYVCTVAPHVVTVEDGALHDHKRVVRWWSSKGDERDGVAVLPWFTEGAHESLVPVLHDCDEHLSDDESEEDDCRESAE